MANDSGSPGFLTQTGTPPLYDDALLDLFQPGIVAIGGYADPTLVRPRWQAADTPNQPDYGVDWVGFGVARTRADTNTYQVHVASGPGYNLVEYTEEVDLLISCYGPASQGRAQRLRDGFKVEQNRAFLNAHKMDLLFVGEPVTIPALLHGVWVRRVDVTVTVRRYVSVKYDVLTVLDLPGVANITHLGIDNELYLTPIVGPD